MTKLDGDGQVHVHVLLDESGSMAPNRQAVIDGTNEFINSLKSERQADRAVLGITAFDDTEPMVREIRTPQALKSFAPLGEEDYAPNSMTPLNDAVAATIGTLRNSRVTGEERVMLIIFTDGLENASVDYPERGNERLKKLIADAEADGFTFVYLGANVDAVAEGSMLNLKAAGQSLHTTASPTGTRSALRAAGQMAHSHLAGASPAEVYAANEARYGDVIPEVAEMPQEDARKKSAREKAADVLG